MRFSIPFDLAASPIRHRPIAERIVNQGGVNFYIELSDWIRVIPGKSRALLTLLALIAFGKIFEKMISMILN
jgi:hypothetical protein